MRAHFHRWLLLAPLLAALLGSGWTAAQAMPQYDPPCQELLQDGGFESGTGWTINPSAYPATYVQYPTHSGQYAMRLGIVEDFNRLAYSSIQQRVTLPATAQHITLRFHVYPLSEATAGDDQQQVVLLDPASGDTVAVPWRTLSNGQAWSAVAIDLTPYRGRTLLLYFNVYNDGTGGRTAMYLDDVSLQVCGAVTPTETPTPRPTDTPTCQPPTPTKTPTATPRPSPTPTPTAIPCTPIASPTSPPGPCHLQCLPNGDFEGYGYWRLGKTPLYPSYVSGKGRGGSRAMRLGNVNQSNVLSYSSIRQEVQIPTWASSVWLRFWYWPLSEGVDGNDHQELLLLRPQCQQVMAILWRDTRDDRQWVPGMADLTPYRGQYVTVYFNVYNDGADGRTAMYLDDVCLEICQPAPPTCEPKPPTIYQPPLIHKPTPSPTFRRPTATPTVTATPTPSPAVGAALPPTPPTSPFLEGMRPFDWAILAGLFFSLLLMCVAIFLLYQIQHFLQWRQRQMTAALRVADERLAAGGYPAAREQPAPGAPSPNAEQAQVPEQQGSGGEEG